MWTRARAGTVHPGDIAPDFTLTKLDKTGTIHLAELYKLQPVVLVFGSYT
jgi:peroxiredoxin